LTYPRKWTDLSMSMRLDLTEVQLSLGGIVGNYTPSPDISQLFSFISGSCLPGSAAQIPG
jgi:hypothetical protein